MSDLKKRLATLRPESLSDVYTTSFIPEIHEILKKDFPDLQEQDISLSFNLKHNKFNLEFKYNNKDGINIVGTIAF